MISITEEIAIPSLVGDATHLFSIAASPELTLKLK